MISYLDFKLESSNELCSLLDNEEFLIFPTDYFKFDLLYNFFKLKESLKSKDSIVGNELVPFLL